MRHRNDIDAVEWIHQSEMTTSACYAKLAVHDGLLLASKHDTISVFGGCNNHDLRLALRGSQGGGAISDFSIGGDRLFAVVNFMMVCPVCYAHCENSTTKRWGVYVKDDPEALINIPCTIRDSLKHVAGRSFNFKADGNRYVLDVYRGHNTTVMGGNDWVMFVTDFNLGAGSYVVFDTSKRTAEAYVVHLGFGDFANDGESDEDVEGEGAGVEVFNIESDEDDHEEGDAQEVVYTQGCVLSGVEESLLDVVLANNDGYIGSFFIHRLTTTNITKKIVKIPRKVAQQLNLPLVGVAGIRLEAGECMKVAYHTDCDGRMVFNNRWGGLATQTNLEEGDAVVFSFKPSNRGSMNIICVVHILRMPVV
ncbi:hypothetical protein ZWY2020_050542 [Hordeum vulgare]|nr:hypothetical protein ZWY2020_050542 [Hordeum vulgare]